MQHLHIHAKATYVTYVNLSTLPLRGNIALACYLHTLHSNARYAKLDYF